MGGGGMMVRSDLIHTQQCGGGESERKEIRGNRKLSTKHT